MTNQQHETQVIRVDLGRWGFQAVALVIITVVMVLFASGIPASWFESSSSTVAPMMAILRIVSFPAAPICFIGMLIALRGTLWPEHLHMNSERMWTRSWSVPWNQLKKVELTHSGESHGGQIVLHVAPEIYEEYKNANRWQSRRPLGVAGLPPAFPTLLVQHQMMERPGTIIDLVREYQRKARS
ncbi:hypothetical protein [Nesterenkonia aerolata]|uniref:PH (Pleckstrin Homology) domain-containing protein n=1 Tax=Nesterenkonia aerolata TaxID=3074079 RepID=A0ABU2DVM9_9MICC|nr:hypothetical protein [Nesterenkonia sp. LY-0111]MDR8020445.1 hypothetical protein [Nesterenkonia sp. LY-0111]